MVTRKQLKTWIRQKPKQVVDLVLSLQHQILSQQEIIHHLQARLIKNSTNSHKPPSTDGYIKPSPKSLRQKSGRQSGGQKGHPGHSLTAVDKPNHTVVHKLTRCSCGCGISLTNQPRLRYETRQVFDLPPLHLEVTEHQAEVKRCPQSRQEVVAPFPLGVNAPLQYGSRFLALLVYWRDQQLLPFDRIRQMVFDLWQHPLSPATIQSAIITTFDRLSDFEENMKQKLMTAPVLHADESGLRVAGALHWLHVLSTSLLTWYGVHSKRGLEAMIHFNILPHFKGRLIHDFWKPYFTFLCAHGLCNAHHLRELVFVHEVLHQRWARKMFLLLLAMHRFMTRLKEKNKSPTSGQLTRWQKRYRALIAQGRRANSKALSPKPKPKRGRTSQNKALNLLDRLQKHQHQVLAFLHDPQVPFSNNQAEQDVRMIKVQQKISGGFRTPSGATHFARIRSYLSTARKNNVNVMQALIQVFNGQPFFPSIPA